MTTVRQLVEQLQEIPDQDQTVIAQYFLAEHFDYALHQGNTQATAEEFDRAAENLDPGFLWDKAAEIVNDELMEQINNRKGN
jgi:hypothetical protein